MSIFYLSTFGQQTSISGIVSIFNSKYTSGKVKFVHLAQVEEELGRSQTTTTDQNGKFKLIVVGIKERTRFRFAVTKENLSVVNIDQLEVIAGQLDTVKIFMAQPNYIADFRREIYNVGRTAAEKNLDLILNKLRNELDSVKRNDAVNFEKIRNLENELYSFQKKYSEVEKNAKRLAEKYSRINLDESSDLLNQAFEFFQKGDLEAAIQTLEDGDIEQKGVKSLNNRETIEKLENLLDSLKKTNEIKIKGLIEPLVFKADLHELLFQLDRADSCYSLLFKLDSTDHRILSSYADFSIRQNRFDNSLRYSRLGLSLSISSRQRVDYLRKISLNFKFQGKFVEAENYLNEAIELIQSDTASSINKVLLSKLYSKRGQIFLDRQIHHYAKESYLKSLKIAQDLFIKDPKKYKLIYATLLGEICSSFFLYDLLLVPNDLDDKRNMMEYYDEAIMLLKDLDDEVSIDSDRFILDLKRNRFIGLAGQFGFEVLGNKTWKEEILDKELSLLSNNSQKAQESNIYLDLGTYYFLNKNFKEAEVCYLKAIRILKNLVSMNSERFEPVLAQALYRFGRFKFKTGENHKDIYKNAFIIAQKYSYLPAMKDMTNELLNFFKIEEVFPSLVYWQKEVEKIEDEAKSYWIDASTRKGFLQKQKIKKDYQLQILRIWVKAKNQNPQISEIKNYIQTSYQVIANSSLYTQEFSDAEYYSKKANSIDTRDGHISINLALALLYQGKYQEAKAVIDRHINLNYTIGPNIRNIGFNPSWYLSFYRKLLNLLQMGIKHKDISKLEKYFDVVRWEDVIKLYKDKDAFVAY